ncbi:hypothetical protein BC833DRAFT_544292 [Globomyces pollinis-pini]|nr:hypothetical protein BC833DRAFT_544292 [Globomyces pollinis-pini]
MATEKDFNSLLFSLEQSESNQNNSSDLDFWLSSDFIQPNQDSQPIAFNIQSNDIHLNTPVGQQYLNSILNSTVIHNNNLSVKAKDIETTTTTQNTTESTKKRSAPIIDQEEKRLRNTEASARFRAKKKAREQAIANEAQLLKDKVSSLENKVKEQEMEIKWLRKLITEKDAKLSKPASPPTTVPAPKLPAGVSAEQLAAAMMFALNNVNTK